MVSISSTVAAKGKSSPSQCKQLQSGFKPFYWEGHFSNCPIEKAPGSLAVFRPQALFLY
jgi:hypothetical protein